jgi:hypothetical protein
MAPRAKRVTGHTYRISVIPAGAVIDPRLKAQDVRVLGLLGRHTDSDGWCRRSQVKMAGELGCSRGTVQGALDRLACAGWVNVRLEGRGGVGPNPDKQPFAAHSYRVLLDGEHHPPAMPKALDECEIKDPIKGGANPLAPPTCQPDLAPGANPELAPRANPGMAPLEEVSSNYSLEPDEREIARVREVKRRFSREFRKRWPTAAIDDQRRLDKAIDILPENQHQPCLDGIEPFVEDLKKHGRGHLPAGWKYLEERRWTLLPPKADAGTPNAVFKSWSREWWGLLLMKIATSSPTAFMVEYATTPGKRETSARAIEMPSADALAGMQSFPSDGYVMQAWRPWFERHGVKLPQWRERVWVWLPGPAPPHGSNAWNEMSSDLDHTGAREC